MFFFRLRVSISNVFFRLSLRKKLLRGLATAAIVALILTAAFFSSREWIMWHVDFTIAQHRHRNLTTADFQYDFDHLIRVLEEDWPFFELSISANGVDVHQLADDFRNTLADTDVDAVGFFELLREDFFRPIGSLGHLWTTNYPRYFQRWHRPVDHMFWEEWEMTVFGEIRAGTRHNAELARHLPSRFLYHSLRDAGIGSQPDREEPVYETHILSDNTALLSVRRMIHLDDDPVRRPRDYRFIGCYAALLYDFWYEIIDFDHLIIDLRDNPGGRICHFSMYVAPMLITSRTWLPAYVFYGDGHYTNIAKSAGRSHSTMEGHMYVVPEPVFHVDPGNLDVVFRSSTSWWPPSFHYVWGDAFFDIRWESFAGKVWVLTNERTASAAEAVTAMLLLNDLATVVGQPTVGIIGTGFERDSIGFALPNSGVIIRIDTALYKCYEGNILQGYGLQPHYAPREGMDALETVLAMIAEGAY